MDKPIINSFSVIAPLVIQKYESYLPTAFDPSLSMLEKLGKIIEYLNQIGSLSNSVVEQWNTVMEWVMNDGLNADVISKMDAMLQNGEFATMFDQLTNTVTQYKTDMQNQFDSHRTDMQNQFDQEKDDLNTQEAQHINDVKDTLKGIYSNVLDFGGTDDGITPNDQALINAGINKKVYFPQNSSGNAVYYFTNDPNFNNWEIFADDGVILSFPDNWFESGTQNANFISDVTIRSRDRSGNDAPILKNDAGKQPLIFGGDLGFYDEEFIQQILNMSQFAYNDTGLQSGSRFDVTNETYSPKDGNFAALMENIKIGEKFSCLLNGMKNITDYSAQFGIVVANSDKTLYCTIGYQDGTKIVMGYGTNTGYNIIRTIPIPHLARQTGAAWWYGQPGQADPNFILSVRRIDDSRYQFLVNSVEVGTFYAPFEIESAGFFTMFKVDGLSFERPVKCVEHQNQVNHSLKIALFGDSLGNGDGSGISLINNVKKILQYRQGIQSVTADNYSVGGEKISQIYNRILGTNLSGYDCVIIEAGTNDVLGSTDPAGFYQSSADLINYLLGQNKRIVICDIPPSLAKSDTNIGAGFYNSNQTMKYRHYLKYRGAESINWYHNIAFASNNVGSNSSTFDEFKNIIQDNVHLTNTGASMFAKSIAKAVLSLYAPISR